MQEGRPMVCYSKGAIDSLVDKLKYMKISHPMVDPLLQDLESLREDPVNKFARGRATHNQVKVWMKQIRELVFDIEDWIDSKLATNLGELETDIEQINEFKAKIKEAHGRCKRYNLLDKAPTSDADLLDAAPNKVAVDSRLLWEEKAILIGVDGPKKRLEEHLKDKQKKRKVVSIVGIGGQGKTTLAREVYENLNWQFECHAFVTVGWKTPTTALMDVLLQVNPQAGDNRESLNEQNVIPMLWEFLKTKRYLVFIDDIRNTQAWSIINCALPYNDHGSRILTTTRVNDVAMSCSIRPTDTIYEMESLDNDHSRKLLITTISTQTEERPGNFDKICHNMLAMCCGLPLAIIATAGLLARKSIDVEPFWMIEESCLFAQDQYSMSEGMRKVLEICFADLSLPVKSCFLYLSAFPENYTIEKDRLIWKWVAEGFIPKRGHESLWETGESYFNELMCRKLIQPVFDDYNDDRAVVFTVHCVIHDFIASLSRQENFLTVAAELISGPFPCGTIRRFSIDCSRKDNDEADILVSNAVHLSRVRSLMVFGAAGKVPHLSAFNHVRVLDLEDAKIEDIHQLESLSLLRYLGLKGTNVTKLPEQIVALKQLATLDLSRTGVMELPVVRDTRLVSVLSDGLIIPIAIGEMKQLEDLSTVFLLPDNVGWLVDMSRQLRMLGVRFGYMRIPTETNQQGMKHFLEEVGKSNLQSLFLDDYPYDSVDLLVDSWAHKIPHYLRKFELRISYYLRVVPQKMASLMALTHLHIRVREVEAQGLFALGNLPNLTLLNLFSIRGTHGRLTISSKDGFQCLKLFCFSCSFHVGMGLQFDAGAMPQLRRLQIDVSAWETKFAYGDFNFGIQHLHCLVEVRAIIRCQHATALEAEAMKAAIRDQVSRIPGKHLEHGGDLELDLTTDILGDKDTVFRKEATNKTDIGSTSMVVTKSFSSTSMVVTKSFTLPESSSHLPIPGLRKIQCNRAIIVEDAMVSASVGAMNSLLTKLTTLTERERYAELKGMGKQNEFQAMNALLKQLSGMTDLNKQVEWKNQLRELTYEIEDYIDDLTVHFGNKMGTGYRHKRAMLPNFLERIKKLKEQVAEPDLQSMARKTEVRTLRLNHMVREQWLSKAYDGTNGLVGMAGPQEEIVMRLIGDDELDKPLQLVCIFGAAGIGKTTLATQVYNEIKMRFDCSAFISTTNKVDISDKVHMASICRSILSQLGETFYSKGTTLDYLKSGLRSCLEDKRFLIVIDGVWSAQILEDIKGALPENSRGSRIITTTCNSDVAESCSKHFSCFSYPMKQLSFEESISLFRNIIFRPGRSCPIALEKDHEEIVKACRGIPLAVRLMAGTLSSKPAEVEHWVTLRNIMNQEGMDHLNVEWIKKIFDICYSDLSCDMKTCLLYLSAFPENEVIRKDRLIRRWIAEGFLTKISDETWWESGESCFLELIARNLIEPVYDEEDVMPIGCKVSGSLHGFVTSLSSEENFVKSDVTEQTYMQHGVFRRLTVDISSDNRKKTLDLFKETTSSKARSLTFMKGVDFREMPSLSAFKHVRVLDLEDTKGMENKQLEIIGCLSLLTYLGLGGTDVTELPQQIMALQELTTLDLRRTRVKKLPGFRGTNLLSLLADELILLKGMGEMPKLEELSKVLVGPDGSHADDVAGLFNKLRRLAKLVVRFSRLYDKNETDPQGVKHFLEEVGKSGLQSFALDIYVQDLLDILIESWAYKRPQYLQKFELRILGCLRLVPQKIASLMALTHLHIHVEAVESHVVGALGGLANLVLLKLCSNASPRLVVSSKDGFRCLKVFWHECKAGGGMGLQFEAGAMPQLRRLRLDFNVGETVSTYGDFDFGIQHLDCLVHVRATIDCEDNLSASEVAAHIKGQVSQNPNNPVLELNRRRHGNKAAEEPVIVIDSLEQWSMHINEANSTDPPRLLVIHFTDVSCQPSRRMAPVFAELAKKFPNVFFLKVDIHVEGMQYVCEYFRVGGTPTFLFMKGGKAKDRVDGAKKEELEQKLARQMAQ